MVVLGYTTVYAVRTWQQGNRRGGMGLFGIIAGVTALTVYVLFFHP